MDNKIVIYGKTGGELLKIDVDDNSYRYRAIMTTHTVTLYYSLAEHVDIPVGSYIIYQAVRYTLWVPENFKKIVPEVLNIRWNSEIIQHY